MNDLTAWCSHCQAAHRMGNYTWDELLAEAGGVPICPTCGTDLALIFPAAERARLVVLLERALDVLEGFNLGPKIHDYEAGSRLRADIEEEISRAG